MNCCCWKFLSIELFENVFVFFVNFYEKKTLLNDRIVPVFENHLNLIFLLKNSNTRDFLVENLERESLVLTMRTNAEIFLESGIRRGKKVCAYKYS